MARILVVDDDDLVRDITVSMLRREGHELLAVDAAHAALEVLERERPDLVLTDLVMPGRTGLELLQDIRDRDPDVPVLLMTGGSAHPEEATEALGRGAAQIVHKPFSRADLTSAVEAALAGG